MFVESSASAREVRALDLSSCIREGGRVICPNIAPPAITVLSLEQFEALQKATALSQEQVDEAKKALSDN